MKTFKLFAVAAAALLLTVSSFQANAQTKNSVVDNVVSALTSQNGNSAGSALLSLYNQYKADGKLDLKNTANITNILTLASNIKGLAQQTNTSSFLSGLIKGSKNLVNNANSGSVLSALSNLSNLDLSSLGTSAATSAASSLLSKLKGGSSNASSNNSGAANAASSILSGLFGQLAK